MADLTGWEQQLRDLFIPYLTCRVRALGLDRRLRVRFSASDIVGETLARAVTSPEPCRGDSPEQRLAWLERIQERVLIDKWREGHADKRDFHREEEFCRHLGRTTAGWEKCLAASQLSPDQQAEQKEIMRLIVVAIEGLPPRQREVAIAHLLLGQSLQEVADTLGESRGSVGNLHRGALKQLRRELESLRE